MNLRFIVRMVFQLTDTVCCVCSKKSGEGLITVDLCRINESHPVFSVSAQKYHQQPTKFVYEP